MGGADSSLIRELAPVLGNLDMTKIRRRFASNPITRPQGNPRRASSIVQLSNIML